MMLNSKAAAAVRGVKGMAGDGRSMSQSRSLMHENSVMGMDKQKSMHSQMHHEGGAAGATNGTMMTMGNIGLARQTLFARITGGKS